jgi:dihydroorotate dehydrogenase electron transfer subunit
MVQADALVTNTEECGPFVRVTLVASTLRPGLTPGRFVLADLGGYLRTPLFPAFLDTSGSDTAAFDVLVPPDHPLAILQPDGNVSLIGPLGHGFDPPSTARRLLLVASSAHLGALLPLTTQKPEGSESPGFSIALLLSAPTAANLYPVQLLPPTLEVHVVTADGSCGHRGSTPELFPDLARWADCICIAGDPAIYPQLAEIVREVHVAPGRGFAQALVMPPLACGVGACQGCAVPVAHGTRLACIEGPVFDLLELR